jgi:hypothetical protein
MDFKKQEDKLEAAKSDYKMVRLTGRISPARYELLMNKMKGIGVNTESMWVKVLVESFLSK